MKLSKVQVYLSLGFIVLLICSDQITGNLLRYLYFHQKTGQGQHLSYVFSKCNSDILIFGNSRAQHHYIPKVITDSLNLSYYNAGIDGGHSVILTNAQIKVIVKRYIPKIIIIELDPSFTMKQRNDEYDRLSILLPYYHVYPELKPLILKRSYWEPIKLLSAIYPYNSEIINIIRFNTNFDENRQWMFNGYIPIRNKQIDLQYKEPDTYEDDSSADPEKLKALEEIIQLCNDKKIKLLFINSPIFNTGKTLHMYKSKSAKQIIAIIENRKATFIDFSNNDHFNGQFSFFADRLHLNETGAKRYSQMIGGILKN